MCGDPDHQICIENEGERLAEERLFGFGWIPGQLPMVDDGLFGHCSCCAHSRDAGCGGPDCPCSELPEAAPF